MKNNKLVLDGDSLTVDDLYDFINNQRAQVELASSAVKKVGQSYKFVAKEMIGNVVYGINTGFGPMASHILGKEQLFELQLNLVRSHAAGMGQPIDEKYVLAAMIVRLNTMLKGYSGVSVELVERLRDYINKRIIPVVPEHGAVGTSGDLVQLAHIALALIGEGEVFYKGQRQNTESLLKKLNIKSYLLKPKEGLSLINGTSMMTGISAMLCKDAEKLINLGIEEGAWALEIVCGFDDSFSEKLSAVRPHPGQVAVAKKMREILKSSQLLRSRGRFHKKFTLNDDVQVIPETVQEVYSLRCTPQVLGPIYDTWKNTVAVVEVEMNSVTDNPVIDVEKGMFLHGGNFHGDYVAAAIDKLKMSIVKLGMLSERRNNFFLNNNVNKFFPPFMNLKKPGLTLALQGLQFVATSTTAHNQTLAFPQYVHSIPTNGDNQDIVSMGTDAALITSRVIENAYIILSIEALTLAQAVDYLKIEKKLSSESTGLFKKIRKIMPKVVEDRSLSKELSKLLSAIKQ